MRLLALLLGTVVLVLTAGAASADPIITPLIVSGLLYAGASTAVASAVAPLISFALIAGIGLLGLFAAQKPPKPEDGTQAIQQSTPPRIFLVGTDRIAGAVACHEEADGDFFWIVALTSHLISGVSRYFFGEEEVTIDGSGIVQELADGSYGHDQIQLFTRLGVVPEAANAQFVSRLGSGIWDSNHRGDGCAQLHMICDGVKSDNFSKIYRGRVPQPSVVADGAFVWDFRDEDQDPTDPSTWVFSRNLALIIAWQECFNEFGPQRDYTKALLPVLDRWKDAADICDENVSLSAGGTEKRYHGGGWFTTENDPKAVRAQMLLACDGHFVERGDGAVVLTVGKFAWTGAVITDRDIIGFSLQNDVADREAINHIDIKFSSPDHGYTTVECDPLDDDADQVARGAVRAQTLEITMAKSFTMARRLAKREQFRQAQKKRGTLDLRLSAINAAYERWIKVESVFFPSLNGKYIENRAPRFALMGGGLRIEWLYAGNGSDIDSWTPASDEGEAPVIPDKPASSAPPVPQNVDVVVTGITLGGGTTGARLKISFDQPSRSDLDYVIRWRETDTDDVTPGDQPGPWTEEIHREELTPSAGRLTIVSHVVTSDTDLEVQVASIGPAGTRSDWSTTEDVTAVPSDFSSTHFTFDSSTHSFDEAA